MSKPYIGDWVLRSVLFIPGHIEEMLRKGARVQPDCFILDLEDAVPEKFKTTGRNRVREALEGGFYEGRTTFVRINSRATNYTLEDLQAVAHPNMHGIVYPRAERKDDIEYLENLLVKIERGLLLESPYFSIIPVCETPLGVINAYEIAGSSSRIVAMIFGCEDYLAELRGRHSSGERSLLTPRSQVAMAARAAGVEPIDSPFVKVHDFERLQHFAEVGRDLGMAGMCALSPRQLPIIHEVFTPSLGEVGFAREIIDAAEDGDKMGRTVRMSDGKFISPPTLKAALKTITRAEAIANLEEYYYNLNDGSME
jgi:citrate lyase subunit beta/citryl-CoA lyase